MVAWISKGAGIRKKSGGRAVTGVLPSIPFTTAIHSSGNSGAVPEGGEQGITTEKYHSGCRLGFAEADTSRPKGVLLQEGCGYLLGWDQ